MNRLRLWPVVALVVAVAIAAFGLVVTVQSRPEPAPDVVLANDVVRTAAERWESLDPEAIGHPDVALSVVRTNGDIVVRQHDAPVGDKDAAHEGAQAYVVTRNGDILGTVYLVDPALAAARQERSSALWQASAGAVALMLVAVLAVLWWFRRRVLVPFATMQNWATEVASGDLSRPLRMDRRNAFGAFSESFDLMRVQLANAKAREAAQGEQTRALIAQLSHDIRTPLASIQAQAELLRIREPDGERLRKLDAIISKGRQIDDLLTELFSANRSDLVSMPMSVQEHYSSELVELLRVADSNDRLVLEAPPDCLVRFDPRRLQQVLDNILVNAEKYAGTAVDVSWRLEDDVLHLRLADHGPGVLEADLPTLLARGTRGTNAEGRVGQGLGLYTAASLMDRMGGSLSVQNLDDGFAVDVQIPLA